MMDKSLLCKGRELPLEGERLLSYSKNVEAGWRVEEGHHLKKEYPFKNFKEALFFVNLIGVVAEEEKHHPQLHLSEGRVEVVLFTHTIDGLSERDFTLASKIETEYLSHFEIAKE